MTIPATAAGAAVRAYQPADVSRPLLEATCGSVVRDGAARYPGPDPPRFINPAALSEGVIMHDTNSNQAVVLGASVAGLLAARVLSERFDRVMLIERDKAAADRGAPPRCAARSASARPAPARPRDPR